MIADLIGYEATGKNYTGYATEATISFKLHELAKKKGWP
jgi:hypothetical protein